MPEVSENAAIFLATSHQALKRAENSSEDLQFCNSTVVLIFVCFYMEETLDVIIDKLDRTKDMHMFLGIDFPGMFKKFAWFYNFYIADAQNSKNELFKNNNYIKTMDALDHTFQHFRTLYCFRNDISHGKINEIVRNLNSVIFLRQAAKEIVSKLLDISNLNEIRTVSYWTAVDNFGKVYQEE